MKFEDRVNLLFANAGIHFVGDIESTTVEQFENVLSTNVKGSGISTVG